MARALGAFRQPTDADMIYLMIAGIGVIGAAIVC
jgi:hypothetical protein